MFLFQPNFIMSVSDKKEVIVFLTNEKIRNGDYSKLVVRYLSSLCLYFNTLTVIIIRTVFLPNSSFELNCSQVKCSMDLLDIAVALELRILLGTLLII